MMRLTTLLLFLGLLSCTSLTAQRVVSTTNKKAIKQFENGIEAMRAGNLEKAKDILESAIETEAKLVEAHIVIGDILSKQQDNNGAIAYYKEAIELAPDFYSLAYFKIAKLSFLEENFEQANEYIKLFLGRKSVDPKYKGFSKKILRDSEFAKVAINQPVDYLLATVPGGINSEYDEYFPTLTADDSTMLYTRMLPVKPGSKAFQEDFFYSLKGDTEWGQSLQLTPDINTPLNEGAPSLSADGRSLIFTVCGFAGGSDYGDNREGFGSCDLFFAVKQGNTWSKAFNLGQGINTSGWESQPSLASDGKTLYFVRGQHGKSATVNIYSSTLDSRGNWSKAQPIKGKVNTKFRESSVFIHPDNQTLYFTSDGHPGMGGDDIFYSRRLEDGSWG